MSADSKTGNEAEEKGGLSGHAVGMICGTVGFIIAAAIGTVFFEWQLRGVAAATLIWLGICYWGHADERAENAEWRLKRIERKLDKVLDHLPDWRELQAIRQIEKPETPTVHLRTVAKNAIAKTAKKWGSFKTCDIGVIGTAILAEPIMKVFGAGGHGASNLLPVAAVAYEAGKHLSAWALKAPAVIEWISMTPKAEMEALSKIPGADKVKIVDDNEEDGQ